MANVISIAAQKGGVGKSTTAMSLCAGLVRHGKKVLGIDADPQNSLTVSFGIRKPEALAYTLTNVFGNLISETSFDPMGGIIHHSEGIDLLPANVSLASMELSLVPVIGREAVLRQYIDQIAPYYDYIVLDTSPSLGLLTLNALAASDQVIIPVTPKFLDVKGLELLLKSIAQVKRQINQKLSISGILLTMVDSRMNFTREIISLVESAYGDRIRIFNERIPCSVRAAETSAQGISIYSHDPRGKVAAAYEALVGEVLRCA